MQSTRALTNHSHATLQKLNHHTSHLLLKRKMRLLREEQIKRNYGNLNS